ncbi:hypothetical protein [Pedobacter nanyangensis]|uniref:hypothetical protein n=1 Tax=Pedobacter nanyangensis TaxID=1562389 RepID=UPI000DE562A8|nr:hypothetical protein [Pedobacter nanyangensis]
MTKKNQISAEITAAQTTAVMENINSINETLKHALTINLTNDDRLHMLKMGDKTLAFVQKALEYAVQNQTLCPVFLDLSEAQKDYSLAAGLQAIKQKVAALLRAIEDAEMVAGGEAYDAALIFYNSVKGAARSNIAGSQAIEDDLKLRFPGRRKSTLPTV